MSQFKDTSKGFGEDFNKDAGAEREESLNAFYNRKQKTKGNKLASDCEAEIASEDRDAEYANYKSDRDAGPMNTPWSKDFYGRNK